MSTATLVTADVVAARLDVKPAYVYRLARRRQLHSVRVGKYVRFDLAQVEADIAALTVPAVTAAGAPVAAATTATPNRSPLTPAHDLPVRRRPRRFS